MDIIISGNKLIALDVWKYMKPHVAQTKNMHWNLYEKTAKAAEIMGDLKLSRSLLKQLEKEKKSS